MDQRNWSCLYESNKYTMPQITSLIHGGSQKKDISFGTLAKLHNIVGFGKSCEIALREMKQYVEKIKSYEAELRKDYNLYLTTLSLFRIK